VVVVREFVSRCSRLTVKVEADSSGNAYGPNRSSIFYRGLSRIRPLKRPSRHWPVADGKPIAVLTEVQPPWWIPLL
jgi:hypothetical protein